MLSTISWVNRSDVSDGLSALFGANANQARLVVDRAILDWEDVIANFNFAGGGNNFNLTVNTSDLTSIAQGGPSSADAQKRPTAGSVTLDSVGTTHWVDPSIGDDAEFTTLTNAFTGFAPSIVGVDLYATMVHEIGHCLGITQNSAYALSNFLSDTGIDDPNSMTAGNLWAFNVGGGAVEATFTASDTGHLWEGPGTAATGTLPWFADDLMNPGRVILSNERNLISNTDAIILQQAYGYSIVLPSTINNMLVNPNFTSDVLTISGLPGSVNDTVTVVSAPGGFSVNVDGYSEIVPLSQTNSIAIATGAGTDVVQLQYNAARPTTVDGGADGGDTLFLTEGATVTLNTVTSSLIGTVTYNNLESLTLTGSTGNDVFSVLSTSSLTPVTINGGNGDDSLYINPTTGALFGYGSTITWNGGGSVDKLQFDMQFSTYNDRYTVASGSVQVQELNGIGSVTVNQVGYSAIDSVVINAGSGNDEIILPDAAVKGTFYGADGNDSFTVGGGNLGLLVNNSTLLGGSGTDTLVLDDSAYSGAVNWLVDDTGVYRETIGVQSYSYVGFEGVELRTGTGGTRGDWIDVNDGIYVNVSIKGGAGPDELRLNHLSNKHSDGFSIITYPLSFDGGTGFNGLVIDDQSRGSTTYAMYPDRLEINESLSSDDADFTHANVSSMSLTASDSFTALNVYGTPASVVPGNQTTVFLGGGNDAANVFPHDAAGNLTVTTNIGINGGSGTDTFTIQDAASPGAINYSFSNPFGSGTQNIFGMGTGGLGTATIENLVVNAGTGADTFDVNQYTSGTGLTINAGSGDDTLNFGNNNLPANITNMSSFLFDGQGGSDTFNLKNASEINQWSYTALAASIQSERVFGSTYYSAILNQANVEQLNVNAGTGTDVLGLSSVAAGETLAFHGGDGGDAINVIGNISSIQGPVYFYGDGGSNSFNQFNNSTTDPTTAHLDQTSFGAFPGDNFFPAGASLHFENLGNMILTFGSGADTVYAQPNLSATVSLRGGGPTTAPGDTLNLALAGAENYVVTPTSATAGNVTSTNLKTLTYSSFETGPNIDDVAPFIVAQSYDGTGVPTISIQFSENVSNSLTTSYLELINTTTLTQVPFAYLALSYDAGTNTASFTFPGYAGGNLPPSEYTAKIYGSLADLFGNAIGVETPFSFSVVAPLPDSISFTGTYSQSFDALPTSGTMLAWSNNSTLAGWSLFRQPAPGTAISAINAGNGSSSTGSFYSFGVLGSGPLTDRALGGLGSGGTYFSGPVAGTAAGWIALAMTNDTGAPIDTLSLGYDGEQWRDGGNTSAQNMELEYGFGNSFITVPTWTAPGGSFDFTSPIHTASAAALDGNAASNRTTGLGGTLTDLGWTVGSTLWVRWVESNDAGNDHALAIDNVHFSLPAAFFGDFNADGGINAADYVLWRKTLGTTGVPAYSGADGNGDGMIDQDDYRVLRAHFGETLPPPGAGSGVGSATASAAAALVAPVDNSKVAETSMGLSVKEPVQSVQPRESSGDEQAASQRKNLTSVIAHVFSPFATYRPAVRGSTRFKSAIAERQRDDALVAWLPSQPAIKKQYDDFNATESWASEDVNGTDDVHVDSVEQVFALMAGS